MVHRLLCVLLDEVVVAEGGKGRVPLSVPYKELEEKLAEERALSDRVFKVCSTISKPGVSPELIMRYIRHGCDFCMSYPGYECRRHER